MSSSSDAVTTTVAAYDLGSAEYARHSSDRSGLKRLHERFRRFLDSGARVLDLGCGPGHDAAVLTSAGLAVTGLDPARGLLTEAGRHDAIAGRLAQGDARHLPFQAAAFDAVWACASLLHLPKEDISMALSELSRCLMPGGILFTSMQHGRGERVTDRSLGLPLRYYFFYGEEEWQSILQSSGFAVIDQRLNPTSSGLTAGATGWVETFARKP